MPSVGIFIGITMSTPYGLPSVLSSSQVRTRSSSSVSLKRTQPEHAEPAGPRDRGRDVLGRREREDRVVDPELVAERGAHQAVTPRAISLAAGYCALPVALRGICGTTVSERGSL